jgi:uncharacterized protein YdaU (DUF1376 family)
VKIYKALQDGTKVVYQPWRNDTFLADEYVQAMGYLEKWMYRTLLQAAFTCSTRPYLPDDDGRLWSLAGCESREMWDTHSAAVRRMFTPETVDGLSLLSQKRVTEDWNRIKEAKAAARESGRQGGLASAAVRAAATEDAVAANPKGKVNQPPTEGQAREVKEISEEKTLEQPSSDPQGMAGGLEAVDLREQGAVSPAQGDAASGHLAAPTLAMPSPSRLESKAPQEKHITLECLQEAWTQFRYDWGDSSFPIGLPSTGFQKLGDTLRANRLYYRVADVRAAFQKWLEDRYVPAIDTPTAIISPLAVFAEDVATYVAVLATEKKS